MKRWSPAISITKRRERQDQKPRLRTNQSLFGYIYDLAKSGETSQTWSHSAAERALRGEVILINAPALNGSRTYQTASVSSDSELAGLYKGTKRKKLDSTLPLPFLIKISYLLLCDSSDVYAMRPETTPPEQ